VAGSSRLPRPGRSQYLGPGYGVNDFDVHFFYLQNPRKPRLTRARKRIVADVVSFDNIAVDFLRTIVRVRMKRPNAWVS
jgi:hypothetical protein